MFFLIGGIFCNWGQMGANVLVEFENVIFNGGIFYDWGQKIILGSRKTAILGIIWTPETDSFYLISNLISFK